MMNENEIKADEALIYWIDLAPGEFHVNQISRDVDTQDYYTRKLEKLVKIGWLERVGKRRGWYRKREMDCKPMDLINADSSPVSIWLPFHLSDLVQIHPGNVIIIAGAPNSGKTALFLNIIKENQCVWNTHYFTSEMDPGELRLRLDKFPDVSIDMWDFKAYKRGGDFSDVIKQGPGKLNLIDFLEVHDEFYIIAARLKEIHDRLNGAVAIVGLQKNPGSDTGLGGWRSMEVTRLALAMEYGRCKITKAKNWVDPTKNPNGWEIRFKLLDGCRLMPSRDGWTGVKDTVPF